MARVGGKGEEMPRMGPRFCTGDLVGELPCSVVGSPRGVINSSTRAQPCVACTVGGFRRKFVR